jgi:hypothetical protein
VFLSYSFLENKRREEEEEDEAPRISDSQGMKALEKCLAYVEPQLNATASDVLLIKEVERYCGQE